MGNTVTPADTTPSSPYFSWGLGNLYRKFEVTWIDHFTENMLGVFSIYYFVQSIFIAVSSGAVSVMPYAWQSFGPSASFAAISRSTGIGEAPKSMRSRLEVS